MVQAYTTEINTIGLVSYYYYTFTDHYDNYSLCKTLVPVFLEILEFVTTGTNVLRYQFITMVLHIPKIENMPAVLSCFHRCQYM